MAAARRFWCRVVIVVPFKSAAGFLMDRQRGSGSAAGVRALSWQALLAPRSRLPEPATLDGWLAMLHGQGARDPFSLALLGGRLAQTPGLAFLAGYQAALRCLWPDAPEGLGALCASERRSLRPADVQARFERSSLSGTKDFVTGGTAARWLLVAAREEAPGERPRLALCAVEAGASGVTVEAGAALPLLPDIPHGRLRLTDAPCQRLEGDGWADYVKPFRLLEDLYVLLALVSWLYGIGLEAAWPQRLQLRLLSILIGAAETARQAPQDPAAALLLGALDEQFAALQSELDGALATAPRHWSEGWRDRAVLALAGAARERRLAQAAAQFGLAPGRPSGNS